MIKIFRKSKLPSRLKIDVRTILTIGAAVCLQTMHERVSKGKTIEGSAFKPYTKRYALWKESKGRHPGTKGDWLRYTGAMLGSHQIVEMTDNKFVLGFSGTRTDGRSNALIAYVNNNIRPFVGLNEREKNEVFREVKKELIGRTLGEIA